MWQESLAAAMHALWTPLQAFFGFLQGTMHRPPRDVEEAD